MCDDCGVHSDSGCSTERDATAAPEVRDAPPPFKNITNGEWAGRVAAAFSRLESVTSQEAATIEQLIGGAVRHLREKEEVANQLLEQRDEAHVQRKRWKAHALRLEQRLADQEQELADRANRPAAFTDRVFPAVPHEPPQGSLVLRLVDSTIQMWERTTRTEWEMRGTNAGPQPRPCRSATWTELTQWAGDITLMHRAAPATHEGEGRD